MKKQLLAVLAVAGAFLLPAAAAEAANGRTTGDVNMRAGPSTSYPRIVVLQRGTPVTIHGCLQGRSWCDVSAYRERGWVSSRYLDIFYNQRRVYVPERPAYVPPTITFGFGYWDRHYSDRSWYRDRRWRDRDDWRDRDGRHDRDDWRRDRRDRYERRGDWDDDRRDRDRDRDRYSDRDRDRDRVRSDGDRIEERVMRGARVCDADDRACIELR